MIRAGSRKRWFGVGAVALTATSVVALVPNFNASAAGAPSLKITYHVTGTSTVKKPNSVVKLGPATLHLALRSNGSYTGSLKLPPARTSFKAEGLFPVSATATFIQVGKLTGSLKVVKGKVHVSSVAHDILRLSNVKVAGVATDVGGKCQTKTPIALSVTNKRTFDLTKGGSLSGAFPIPNFTGCGLHLIGLNLVPLNLLLDNQVSGPGNTVSLHLTHGRVVG
jgi:hypothetical protein